MTKAYWHWAALLALLFLLWREQRATVEAVRVLTEVVGEVSGAQDCDREEEAASFEGGRV